MQPANEIINYQEEKNEIENAARIIHNTYLMAIEG